MFVEVRFEVLEGTWAGILLFRRTDRLRLGGITIQHWN